ncbi:hypothetical protein EIP91_004926 [Steccherinum ochraceum]|uniref:Uncharacterized protein n=1 Tax=Steccherinum ochraceum TaxID=92696 RepID=A0A4R0RN84_9APHY|nr:hypothetical protein EIP91_004926 [Steccherinum ochraceum]
MAPKKSQIQPVPEDSSEPSLSSAQSTAAVAQDRSKTKVASKRKKVAEENAAGGNDDDGPGTTGQSVKKKKAKETDKPVESSDDDGPATSAPEKKKKTTTRTSAKPAAAAQPSGRSKPAPTTGRPAPTPRRKAVEKDAPVVATVSSLPRIAGGRRPLATCQAPKRSKKAIEAEAEAEYQPDETADEQDQLDQEEVVQVQVKPARRKGKANAAKAKEDVVTDEGEGKKTKRRKTGKKAAKEEKTEEELAAEQRVKEEEEAENRRNALGESLRAVRRTAIGTDANPHALAVASAFLGYATIPLLEGWNDARYRVFNSRPLKEDDARSMVALWKARSPDYAKMDAIINVSMYAKHVDTSSLVQEYETAEDLKELVVRGVQDEDYVMYVLGGNHRRAVYEAVMEYHAQEVKRLKAELEEMEKLRNRQQQTLHETHIEEDTIEQVQKAIDRHQELIDRGPIWAVAVYDKGLIDEKVEKHLSENDPRVFVRATLAETMWAEHDRVEEFEAAGAQRGTNAWDVKYKDGGFVTNQDYIFKNVFIFRTLGTVGKYSYWRNGHFIHPRCVKEKF